MGIVDAGYAQAYRPRRSNIGRRSKCRYSYRHRRNGQAAVRSGPFDRHRDLRPRFDPCNVLAIFEVDLVAQGRSAGGADVADCRTDPSQQDFLARRRCEASPYFTIAVGVSGAIRFAVSATGWAASADATLAPTKIMVEIQAAQARRHLEINIFLLPFRALD